MALFSNSNYHFHHKILNRLYLTTFHHSVPKFLIHNETFNEKSMEDVDALDDFTSQLIQKKTFKWENKKKSVNNKLGKRNESMFDVSQTKFSNPDIANISTEKINELFQSAIEFDDNIQVMNLMQQCIKYKKCPTLSILINVLSIYSQNGDKDTVTKITDLCIELHPQLLEDNSHFRHYLAEAIWIKGNIPKSLEMFELVYRENAFLRRRIRLMLKYLIIHVVGNHSEAALFNLVQFSETLLNDFKDFFPIACVWQACFLSEWFTDQCLAMELLERNEGLCKAIVNRIPFVVAVSLKGHKTDVVYRLLEILLKFDMKSQYSVVLFALLEYQFRKGDLSRCSEIIQWSIKNNVTLPTIQHEKFLNLLLKHNIQVSKPDQQNRIDCNFNYKF